MLVVLFGWFVWFFFGATWKVFLWWKGEDECANMMISNWRRRWVCWLKCWTIYTRWTCVCTLRCIFCKMGCLFCFVVLSLLIFNTTHVFWNVLKLTRCTHFCLLLLSISIIRRSSHLFFNFLDYNDIFKIKNSRISQIYNNY